MQGKREPRFSKCMDGREGGSVRVSKGKKANGRRGLSGKSERKRGKEHLDISRLSMREVAFPCGNSTGGKKKSLGTEGEDQNESLGGQIRREDLKKKLVPQARSGQEEKGKRRKIGGRKWGCSAAIRPGKKGGKGNCEKLAAS